MPVNPYLLNQAAQGTEAPLNAFMPAFQQAQDRLLKRDVLEEERQQRHAQNLLKWNEYVQKARQDESAQKNRATFQEKFSALDPNDPNYGMEAHRLATMYGQDLEGASLIPKDGDGASYNLDTRYNAAGDAITVDPRNRAELNQANSAGYTLTSPPNEGKPDQRTQKIEALVGQPGADGRPISLQDATAIVDGLIKVEINEKTGNVVRTDLRTNTVDELPIRGAVTPDVTASQEGMTMWDAAEEGTGAWSAFVGGLWNPIAGQFTGDAVDESITQARQTLKTSMGELRRSMAINPRFPVAEMDRIEEEISISPSAWDSPTDMRARMKSVEDSLNDRIRTYERDANDPKLSSDIREAQRRNATALKDFVNLMGVPKGQKGGPEVGSIDGGYQYLGGDPSNPENWEKVK